MHGQMGCHKSHQQIQKHLRIPKFETLEEESIIFMADTRINNSRVLKFVYIAGLKLFMCQTNHKTNCGELMRVHSIYNSRCSKGYCREVCSRQIKREYSKDVNRSVSYSTPYVTSCIVNVDGRALDLYILI